MNNYRTLSDLEDNANVEATPTRIEDAPRPLPHLAAPPPPSVALSPLPSLKGQAFGEYEILDDLGHGGMGRVYKARHVIMDKIVAVKTIKSDLFQSQEAVSRFLREARAAGRVVHPNIVAAHHAGKVGDTYYLVMEYVDGATLQHLVRDQGPMSISLACGCIGHAAAGLAFAHRQGIIHRDVKPSNLMLVGRRVKVLDLGLARFVEGVESEGEDAAVTSTCPIGTPDYMSPEQCRDSRQVDARTDIYSLGCTLYFLCVGQHIYGHLPSVFNKLVAHLHDPVPSLRAVRAEVPQRLEAVYQKMMAKRPNDRFSSMEEVVEAIKSLSKPLLATSGPGPVEASAPRSLVPPQSELSQSYSPDEGEELKLKEEPAPAKPDLPLSLLAPAPRRIQDLPARTAKRTPAPDGQRRPFTLAASAGVCLLIAAGLTWASFGWLTNSGSRSSASNAKPKTSFGLNLAANDRPAAKKLASKIADAKNAAASTQAQPPPTSPPDRANAQPPPNGVYEPPFQPQTKGFELRPVSSANPGPNLGGWPAISRNSVGMVLLHIPHGRVPVDPNFSELTNLFTLRPVGLPPLDEIRNFWLAAHEVTQKQYQQLMSVNPSAQAGPATADHPVENINWFDAVAFCNALSAKENLKPYYDLSGGGRLPKARILGGSGYRLPTDAEWELASLAGARFMPFRQPLSSELEAIAWGRENSIAKGQAQPSTHPVGQKQANPYGLHDLKGNVWEWCQPWVGNSPNTYQSSIAVSEWIGKSPGVLRGGSFLSEAPMFRDPSRIARLLDDRQPQYGFRVARDGGSPNGAGSAGARMP